MGVCASAASSSHPSIRILVVAAGSAGCASQVTTPPCAWFNSSTSHLAQIFSFIAFSFSPSLTSANHDSLGSSPQ